jgi:hypothetical protein
MFTGYFDASGTALQPCLAVAGFVASVEQWHEFEGLWLRRLGKDDLEIFHATEVRRRWKDDPRRIEALYFDLIDILASAGLEQFGCCIVNSAFDSLSQIVKQEGKTCSYSVAGWTCASLVRSWSRTFGGRMPELVFEHGDDGSGKLKALLEKKGFPSPISKPKTRRLKNGSWIEPAIPLQAADLLAFEFFDPVRKIETDGYLSRIRPSYEALSRIPGSARAIMTEELKDLYRISEFEDDKVWTPSPADAHLVALPWKK